MNYSTVSEFAETLKEFSKDFKKYTRTIDRLGTKIDSSFGIVEKFDNMSVEDYYYDLKVQTLAGQPAHQAVLAGMSDQKEKDDYLAMLKNDVIVREPFQDLDEEKIRLYEERLDDLRSYSHSGQAQFDYESAENEAYRERRDFDKIIGKVIEDNESIRSEFEAELAHLQSEREVLTNRFTRRMKNLSSDKLDEKKQLSEDFKKELGLFDRKIRLYNAALSLCDTFKSELSNIRESNNNLEFVFNENKEIISALSSRINGIKTANIDSDAEVERAAVAAEKIAQKVDGIKNRSIVIDFVKNDDNTYDIYINKGSVSSTQKGVKAEDLTADYVQRLLNTFAREVAANTKDLTKDDIINSRLPVIIKENGVEKNRELFEDVGLSVVNNFANVHTGPVNDGPGTDGPDAGGPGTGGPDNGGPGTGGPDNSGPGGNDGPGTGGPDNSGPGGNDGPGTGGPDNSGLGGNDGPGTGGPNSGEFDMAEHCYKIRSARKAKFDKLRQGMAVVGGIAAVGLGLVSGLTPAVVAAGIAFAAEVGVTGIQKAGDIVDAIRRGAVKHKLKKAVRKTGLKLVYDKEKGTVKYAFKDGADNVFLTGDNQDLANEIQKNLDKEFEYINGPKKKRGFENNPRVTVDNLEAAYAEFGGLLNRKERDSWNMADGSKGWKAHITDLFKRNKKALEDERTNAAEVSIDELEHQNELGDHGVSNPPVVGNPDAPVVLEPPIVGNPGVPATDSADLSQSPDFDVDATDLSLDGFDFEAVLNNPARPGQSATGTPRTPVTTSNRPTARNTGAPVTDPADLSQDFDFDLRQAMGDVDNGAAANNANNDASNEDLDISALNFADMFNEIDSNNDVNAVNIASEAEVVAALNSNTLTSELACAYIVNNNCLNDDLVALMVDKGLITQSLVNDVVEAKKNNQVISLS